MRLLNVSDLMFTTTTDIQNMLDAARAELYALPRWSGEYYATEASIRILEEALEQRKRKRDFGGPDFGGPKF